MPESASEYHDRTKHSPRSVREGSHRLDFENKPTPYKTYVDRPQQPLPDPILDTTVPALQAITEPTHNGDPSVELTLESVGALCYESAGITREIERQGRTHEFRAAACTGALYHVDLYLVCGELPAADINAVDDGEMNSDADITGDALPAGVYHYDPTNHALDVLRERDCRGVIAKASGHDAVSRAPLSIVTTSTWWRNAWKYGDRTFRHAFWDSGTILANLLASAYARDLRSSVVTVFADGPVVDLLGVDPVVEAPLQIVPIGSERVNTAQANSEPTETAQTGTDSIDIEPTDIEPIDPETKPLSSNPQSFPLIHEAWSAGVLEDGTATIDWRATCPDRSIGTRESGNGDRIALEPVDRETATSRPLTNTIERRGSCRQYEREPISFAKLSTILDRAVRGIPMDVRPNDGDQPLSVTDCYVLVNDVDGLDSGTYHYHPSAGELELLRQGKWRQEAGHLALDQRLAADAAVCIYFLTDIEAVFEVLGDRGYRVAQLEAALTAGRLYLGTYAHRTLGGTGLTFYDDVVTDFFSPRAAGQTPMFLYTIGRPA